MAMICPYCLNQVEFNNHERNIEITKKYEKGEKVKELAKEYRLHPSTILKLIRREQDR